MSTTHNIFISHSWAYTDAYDKVVNLLEDRSHFLFRNYSVPKNDPVHNAPNSTALEEAIKKKMSSCHVILIMAGVYATYSTWIKKEVKLAKEGFAFPKPVLAIKPWANKQTSTFVTENADKVVGWNTDSIVQAIRELS